MKDEQTNCYEELFEKVLELQGKYPSLMIAGNMAVQALRIYRSVLNDEEFKSMMVAIVKSEDQIKPFDRPTLQ